MLTIYHLEMSRSERIIWLAEELSLTYTLERFARGPDMRAPEAMKAIHPLGKSPVIRNGDTVVMESAAIAEYIIHRLGDGRLAVRPDEMDYPHYIQFLHFAESSLQPILTLNLFVGGFFPGVAPDSPLVAMAKAETAKLLAFLDHELAGRPWFGGAEFTAADIMMSYGFGVARGFLRIDMAPYPHISEYLDRIEARPAYRAAMAIANPRTS